MSVEEKLRRHDDYRSRQDAMIVVAVCGNQIVGAQIGFALIAAPEIARLLPCTKKGDYYICEGFVAEPYRGQGIAHRLRIAMDRWMKDQGFLRRIVRISTQSNLAALRRHGFRVVVEQAIKNVPMRIAGNGIMRVPHACVLMSRDVAS
jgi:GNAT superfamily N-acetyltransferase